ncbi:MAG: MarR family transcriptional regulator, partial [Oscillospiraceae bacterium]|nr:MarR family transcriptional regulator [Oscillospiraceae bacterium]
MTRNEFSLLYSIQKNGIQSYRKMKEDANVSTGFISRAMKSFEEKGFIDVQGITEKGLEALAPYKVDNAVIMAAGLSSRFVPL